MWMPIGKHKIKISSNGKPFTIWVKADAESFEEIKSNFDFQAKESKAAKFIAKDAQEKEAAIFVKDFELREDGIYCTGEQACQDWELKWMTCAAAFTTNARWHKIKGNRMPAGEIGCSKTPASVIGLPMGCFGMIETMRKASFRKMKPILKRA